MLLDTNKPSMSAEQGQSAQHCAAKPLTLSHLVLIARSLYLRSRGACVQVPGRKLMQTSCSIDSCTTTYGTCNTYAGAGCTSGGGCTYTSCSILASGKKDCTWRCSTVSLMVSCDPAQYCKSCTATRGSSCASGCCTWSSCSIDYSVGIPQCTHTCTAAPVSVALFHCRAVVLVLSESLSSPAVLLKVLLSSCEFMPSSIVLLVLALPHFLS